MESGETTLRPVDDDLAVHGVRWRALLGCLTMLATALAWWMDADTVFAGFAPSAGSVVSATVALAAVQVVALVAFVWLPVPACVLCVVDYLIAAFVPGGQPDVLSLGVMLCVGYLSYRLRTWAALCGLLVVWMGQGASAVMSRAPVERLGTVFLINAAAFMVGTAFAYRGRLSRERRLADKLRAAGALHDAVTGELSAIALLSQSAGEGECGGADGARGRVGSVGSGDSVVSGDSGDSGDGRALMRDINRLSLAALDNTHEVIRLLSEADGTSAGVAAASGASDVARYFGRQERRLRNLGFRGTMTVDVDGRRIAPGMARLIRTCGKEVCANIARHADAAVPYRLTVRCEGERDDAHDGGAIIIEQSNGVAGHAAGDGVRDGGGVPAGTAAHAGRRPLRSGFGLALLREQVERHGGTLSHETRDGTWHIRIRLPFAATSIAKRG